MATINTEKIGSVASLAAGATSQYTWHNPPWDTVLSYFAYPVPPTPSGPHGAATGIVEITSVVCQWTKDHYNGDKKQVTITVVNRGTHATGYDLYQSWVS